jgi:hypothetical protein
MNSNIVALRDVKMVNAALQYLNIGAAVLPLWWIEDSSGCACGAALCDSPGKHPIGRLVPHGVKYASKDEAKVRQWWAACPKANIGVATGRVSGIVVVDVDGPKGEAKLNSLLAKHEVTLEAEWCVNTGRKEGGRHFYFAYPSDTNVPSHKDDGLEIKSDGSYVVVPPSRHASGKIYEWVNVATRLGDCPKCIIDFAIRKRRFGPAGKPGRLPADEQHSRVIERAMTGLSSHAPPAWNEGEEGRIRLALGFVPADNREDWLKTGMALHWTGWGDRARAIWETWSQKSDKYDQTGQDKAWESFGRHRGEGAPVTLGTLYNLAKQHGFAEKPPDEIEELNRRYFVVKIGGKSLIGELVTPAGEARQMISLLSVEAFNTWHANRKILVRDQEGNARLKPLAKAWLEHPKRRQYEGVELDPNGPAELSNGCLNLWRGFKVQPKKGQWPLLASHIREVLAHGDPKAAEYIFRWTAWSLQHPGELAEAALVLRGGKGSGKGVFGNTLAKIFGEHALHIFHQSHLTGNFNGHLRSCLFLFADEAFWAGDKKGESVLKGLVTERMLAIEQKGIDVVPWPNRLHVLMAANAEWVVPASHDERRFAVFDVSDRYAKNGAAESERKSYFDALHHELQNGGVAGMLHDLLNWRLDNWHPRQIYETDGLRRQKEQSMPPMEQWFDELLQDGRLPSFYGLPGQQISKRFVPTRALVDDALRRVPRLHGYLTDKAVGDFLRRQGCTPVRSNSARGWQFPPLAQIREAWMKRYDGRVWDSPEQQDWQ